MNKHPGDELSRLDVIFILKEHGLTPKQNTGLERTAGDVVEEIEGTSFDEEVGVKRVYSWDEVFG